MFVAISRSSDPQLQWLLEWSRKPQNRTKCCEKISGMLDMITLISQFWSRRVFVGLDTEITESTANVLASIRAYKSHWVILSDWNPTLNTPAKSAPPGCFSVFSKGREEISIGPKNYVFLLPVVILMICGHFRPFQTFLNPKSRKFGSSVSTYFFL